MKGNGRVDWETMPTPVTPTAGAIALALHQLAPRWLGDQLESNLAALHSILLAEFPEQAALHDEAIRLYLAGLPPRR